MILEVDKNTFVVQQGTPEANIFYLIGVAQRIFRKQGKLEEVEEMLEAIANCQDYEEAIKTIERYGIKFILLK